MAVQPNILFILADDLGYGDLSSMNGGLSDTPVLDHFLGESAALTQQYASSPVCNPSRASLMTGRYPHRTGSIDTLEWRGLERLALDETTLADLLSGGGYRTAHIGKWHLGAFDNRYAPLSRGFDESVCFRGGGHDYFDWRIEYDNKPHRSDGRYLTDVWTDEAIGFLGRVPAGQPFFLNLCYNAPHTPLQVPEEEADFFRAKGLFSEDVCKLYGMIRRMDSGIGRVLEALKANGQFENTIVVFTSDNGPEFMSDYLATPTHTERFNSGLRGSKGSVYEGGVKVPLIIRWPGVLAAGTEIDEMTHFTDWLPTLLAAAEVPLPSSLEIDGYNLLPMLHGGKKTFPDTRFWQWNRYSPVAECNAAVREGDWKLVFPAIPEAMRVFDLEWLAVSMYQPEYFIERGIIEDTEPFRELPGPGQVELYNLSEDPGEARDLAEHNPDKVKSLSLKLENWFIQVEADRRRNH
jgi:arylsulfatase A